MYFFQFIGRPTLLLENYQPWLDLKVPSKVDASLSEVKTCVILSRHYYRDMPNYLIVLFCLFFFKILELVLENFVYPWYR